MRITSIALVLGLSLATAAPAAAQGDNDFWKAVGDWDINIDPTVGNGCYAIASWNGGTVLRIGRNPERDNFYFLIGNPKWASLQPEAKYDIQIQFGNRPVWDVSATGLQFNPGETVYLHAQSNKMEFISEFQEALNMSISYNGSEIDKLKLTGSMRAWNEVEVCQQEMNRRAPSVSPPVSEDPFSEDPFGNGAGQTKNSSSKNRARKE
ncbi:hypothetical protein P1J78_13475 [Psychromarinibacter sp. C21-152]|uniref:Uncharacterized protein n=1 Tax=Psychromarinibacter sediminicola TaxID=3033385 RepID=A0AAE3TAL6_9RHOB|nr:hypothetical protein [Psychromarinibacter sediminicola]MDF0601750.1 hypothetical protein [Psychromarinibacter sediminicola]